MSDLFFLVFGQSTDRSYVIELTLRSVRPQRRTSDITHRKKFHEAKAKSDRREEVKSFSPWSSWDFDSPFMHRKERPGSHKLSPNGLLSKHTGCIGHKKSGTETQCKTWYVFYVRCFCKIRIRLFMLECDFSSFLRFASSELCFEIEACCYPCCIGFEFLQRANAVVLVLSIMRRGEQGDGVKSLGTGE